MVGGHLKLLAIIFNHEASDESMRPIINFYFFPIMVLLLTLTLGVARPSHSRLDTKTFLTDHLATILHSPPLQLVSSSRSVSEVILINPPKGHIFLIVISSARVNDNIRL